MKYLAALLSLCCLNALADDAAIRKSLEDKLQIKIDKISKSPVNGLYEVVAGERVLYADEKGSYYFEGDLVESKTQKSLTAEKRFTLLPLDMAVKTVRGNGKRVVVTFEDPHCGYCKKLARDLVNVKDVTVYTFLLPILSEDSVTKAKGIWCAADRSKAWNDWMLSAIAPPVAPANCDVMPMFRKVQRMSQTMEISGTPFLLFSSGYLARGYISAAEIEKQLASTAPATPGT